jgi:hypothetical protein
MHKCGLLCLTALVAACGGSTNASTTTISATGGGPAAGASSTLAAGNGSLGGVSSSVGASSTSIAGNSPTGGTSSVVGTIASGTGPVQVQDLAHDLAITVCNMAIRCVDSLVIEYLHGVATCAAKAEANVNDQVVTQLNDAIARGTVTYDASAMRTCLDAYPLLNCDYSNQASLLAACQTAWSGHVALGGSCYSNMDCSGGMFTTFCSSTGTCPGLCQARGALGQLCNVDDDCQTDLVCDTDKQACVTRLNLGNPCDSTSNTNGKCGGMTVCQQDTPTSQAHCAARSGAAEGQPCDGLLGCGQGLVCASSGEVSDASSTGIVYTCQKGSTANGPCRYALGNPCPEAQYCPVAYANAATGQAQCTPQLATGAQCSGTVAYECAADGWCGPNNICVVQQHIGGSCQHNGDCYSNLCTNSVCVEHLDCMN